MENGRQTNKTGASYFRQFIYFTFSHTHLILPSMSKDNELRRLEYLSLVTSVTNELSNHIGISDKDVAEYIIHLHDPSKGFAEFKRRLDQDDCGFSDAFIQTL
ncbi:hypothetical protein LPJ60_006094, partial [Coemansia sp. RSA 2675]